MSINSHDARLCGCCGDFFRPVLGRRGFLGGAAGAAFAISGGAISGAALSGAAMAAEGNYEAMLLNCIDPRFPELTLNYMKGRGLAGKYSQFVFAGAAIGAVAPAFTDWQKAFWENLAASMQLHHIKKVIAIDHRDCGAAKIAYGAAAVADPSTETTTHKTALDAFRAQVKIRQPTLEVETGLMSLDGKVEMFS